MRDMTSRVSWTFCGALALGALAFGWLLRADAVAPDDGARDAAPLAHSRGDAPAWRVDLPGALPDPAPEQLEDGTAPRPADEAGKPLVSVSWVGTPAPMTRDPLPEVIAHPTSGAARLATKPVIASLSADGSAVTLALTTGPHTLSVRSAGGTVWCEQKDVQPGTHQVVLDAAHLPGVTGRCIDGQGRPVEGASVRITSLLTAGAVGVISGPDGDFRVPFLSAELLYEAKASKVGYREASSEPLQLEPHRSRTIEPLVMRAACVVSGRVQLADGTPVAGCPVHAVVKPVSHSQTGTDADGRFLFDDLPAGDVRVYTSHSMLRDASVTLPDAPEERTAILVLDEGVFIDGAIHSEDGSPSDNLWIQGTPLQLAGGPALDREATGQSTQVQGIPATFRLGPFPPGLVEVSEAFGAFEKRIVEAPGTVELVLPPQLTLELALRFTDAATGLPINRSGSCGVVIKGNDGVLGSQSGSRVQPDSNGIWTFSRRLPSRVTTSLIVRFPEHAPARVDALETLPPDAAPLEVAVQPEAQFVVRVVDAGGAPVAGAYLFIVWQVDPASVQERFAGDTPAFANRKWFADGMGVVSHATSGADGWLRTPRLANGAVVCVVRAEGFLSWFQRFAIAPSAPGAHEDPTVKEPDLVVTLSPAS
jgi:hypothetical protein